MPAKADGKVNINELAPLLVKEPLFMFLCPRQDKREDFIRKYLAHFIPKYQKEGMVDISPSGIISMLYDPEDYDYKISGKKSLPLKQSRFAGNVLDHANIVNDIVDIIVPEWFEVRVLNVFVTQDCSDEEIMSVVNKYKKLADEEGFVLLYETLSKRLLPYFEKAGYETGYARNIMNTRFFQTVMTYNA